MHLIPTLTKVQQHLVKQITLSYEILTSILEFYYVSAWISLLLTSKLE